MAHFAILSAILVLIGNILIPSNTGYYQTGRFVVNFDQLPVELQKIIQNKGNFAWNGNTSAIKTVWTAEKYKLRREKFTEIDHISCQLFDLNMTFQKNNYTDKPVRFISFMLLAQNKFNVTIFYLEVRGIFIDEKGNLSITPYAENKVSALFRHTWEIHSLNYVDSGGKIVANGEFFNKQTQQTISLQDTLFYNISNINQLYNNGWYNETYEVKT